MSAKRLTAAEARALSDADLLAEFAREVRECVGLGMPDHGISGKRLGYEILWRMRTGKPSA